MHISTQFAYLHDLMIPLFSNDPLLTRKVPDLGVSNFTADLPLNASKESSLARTVAKKKKKKRGMIKSIMGRT